MSSANLLSNAIRILSVDAIEKAGSGHPGMPMGMADIAYVLWNKYLRHNPKDCNWPDRDRFVLSNGHGSMLLYSLLHLSGYDISISDIKSFRQFNSLTPGHPEHGQTPGVETTTGPLGQGFANAVGMALAEFLLAKEFNRPDLELINHRTYVFLGDGCLMEGISHEAASLAGTWGLNKLIAFWDDNGISIDGSVEKWFTEDVKKRFESYGWLVIFSVDGHDIDAIDKAISRAHKEIHRPVLICCRTKIGYGSPNKIGTAEVHGSPLGSSEVAKVRLQLSWQYEPFFIPEGVYKAWDATDKGRHSQKIWENLFSRYKELYPDDAAELSRRWRNVLPDSFNEWSRQLFTNAQKDERTLATRKSSQICIDEWTKLLPEIIGGSADLTPSNLTKWPNAESVSKQTPGRYIHYGVREFGLSAIMNGIALHGGYVPFGGTFLTFSDYARNSIRMSALMATRCIYIFTHDSIGLGEDGPTHQPIEHVESLRLIPNMMVWRPCDQAETSAAWSFALSYSGPTALILSRQNTPPLAIKADYSNVSCGAYILLEGQGKPDVIIIATGTEVAIAVEARAILQTRDVNARVVSMPSTTVFDRQTDIYRESVLLPGVPCVSVESGVTRGWYRYFSAGGIAIGIDHFGASAPCEVLYEAFGLTALRVADDTCDFLSSAQKKILREMDYEKDTGCY
ncbi:MULTISPECIES: transketolase [Candidatus Ichthyocystis]|uniref:transketolase n=1 Tax=Candidatus Ichthyocystis TaxID=2929841 RepID=UPI000AE95E11|nr:MULTISPECIES: transketolase [Ichthyocystis]